MNTIDIKKAALGLALAVPALCAQAAQVSLSGWLYGSGVPVAISAGAGDYRGNAGAFVGTLSGSAGLDSAAFVTYSVELGTVDVRFGPRASSYTVVNGASYFERRQGDAGIADQLARLMTFADDNAGLVNNAAGSASLQLAIWSAIESGSLLRDASVDADRARSLLAGAATVDSRYDVWVLERAGSADLLLLSGRSTLEALGVPEPGSLALVLTALLVSAAAAASRPARPSRPA